MTETGTHTDVVEAWLQLSVARGAELRDLQRALDALWGRARVTLGEITLSAISERAVYDVAQRFPVFAAAIEVDADGVHCDAAAEKLASTSHEELREAVRDLLVTWLTVLGNLTAEILTPALHEELANAAPAEPEPTR